MEVPTGRRAGRPGVLLVGYGVRGRQWHAELRRSRELAAVAAADPDPDAREAARRDGLAAFASLDDALTTPTARTAIVCSPPGEHAAQALACLEAGLPILVEKPLALSVASARAIAERARTRGVPALVGQNFRFLRRERAVRKALAGGAVGAVLSAIVVSARPSDAARPHLRSIEHGPLWDLAIHHVDALRTRFGGVPELVGAERRAGAPGRQTYGLRLEWQNGPQVLYEHSEGAPGYHHAEWLEGERRAISVWQHRVSVLFSGRRPRRVRPPRGPTPDRTLVLELARVVHGGSSESILTAEENLPTVAIIEAAVRSVALGRPVQLTEVLEPAAPGRPADVL